MAVNGVEKVIKLDNAVAVVAKGYWAASQGLAALSPKFSDGGNAGISTASVFAEHDKLRKTGKPENEAGNGDVNTGFAAKGVKLLTADFKVPFLHQAMMEPFALTAHYKDGRLDVWGASQSPLGAKMVAARAAGLGADEVTFHPMIMGGGFGGCTINLVKEELYDQFIADAKAKYSAKYGKEPKVIDVVISDGSRKIC